MTMVARTGIVLVSALLACAPAWARPSPAGRAPASAGQAGPAAIGAARGARTAVEQGSQGQAQAPAGGGAQAPARGAQPPPSPAAPAPEGQAPATTPLEPVGFTYNPEGRRDPFVSLVRRGTTTTRGGVGAAAARPAGLAGLETAEVTLRGIIRSREGFVAMLQGADQKTYIVRAGDKLFDGTVRTISQNDMVILQQVNDPLSLEKQREVRKVLRTVEAN
jgi:Tfp pilus assembly protein PilP